MISSKPTLHALPNRELYERNEIQRAAWYLDSVRETYGATNPTELPKHEQAWLAKAKHILAPTSHPIANKSPAPAPRRPSAPVTPPGWVLQELFKKYGTDTYSALMDEELSESERAQAKAAHSQLGIKNPTSRDLVPPLALDGPLVKPDSPAADPIASQNKRRKRRRRLAGAGTKGRVIMINPRFLELGANGSVITSFDCPVCEKRIQLPGDYRPKDQGIIDHKVGKERHVIGEAYLSKDDRWMVRDPATPQPTSPRPPKKPKSPKGPYKNPRGLATVNLEHGPKTGAPTIYTRGFENH